MPSEFSVYGDDVDWAAVYRAACQLGHKNDRMWISLNRDFTAAYIVQRWGNAGAIKTDELRAAVSGIDGVTKVASGDAAITKEKGPRAVWDGQARGAVNENKLREAIEWAKTEDRSGRAPSLNLNDRTTR